MLYPAELRARAAILPKFTGGAADGRIPIAANGTNFDGARNQAWLRGRAMGERSPATEKSQKAAENLVGLGRLELPTSPLSGVRSSHLSYRPNLLAGNILRDLRRSSNNGGASDGQVARVIGTADERGPTAVATGTVRLTRRAIIRKL